MSLPGRSMQPCHVCLGLDRRSVEDDRWQFGFKDDLTAEYTLDFTFSQLQASVESGCETCSVISSGLELINRNLALFDVSRASRCRFILQPESPPEVEIFDDEQEENEDFPSNACARFQFYTLPESSDDQGPFAAAKDIPSNISVERCSSIVSDWVQDCRLNHGACGASGSANELPRRLLNVRQREDASVVLVETRNTADCQVEQYATLSHCWGTAHVIQTTKANVFLRMRGIAWGLLPKTFQDAIEVVRALGISFMWIDSLCIVQDDLLDWEQESVRMAVIYSNSYINIAATGACDSRGGCFYPRSLKHAAPTCDVKSFAISTKQNASRDTPQTPAIYVRPSLERVHQRYSTRRSHESDLPDSEILPLLSRAWVFQERQLAPRTLHFHPSEMVMECNSSLRCECSGLDKILPQTRRRSLHLQSSDQQDIFNSWLEVVEEYSKLRLTRQSDRLPALTGVATVFQKKLACGYLAGIWQHDIARGILWDVTRFESVRSKRSIRRHDCAPTWSWASLILNVQGSGIIFPAGHDDTFQVDSQFHFLDTGITYAATDINRTVESISVRGLTVTATAHPHDLNDLTWKDVVLIFEEDVEDSILITVAEMNIDCTSECPLTVGNIVHCLLVGNKTNTALESGKKTKYQCILVLKSLEPQQWERVGVMSMKEESIFQGAPNSVFKLV